MRNTDKWLISLAKTDSKLLLLLLDERNQHTLLCISRIYISFQFGANCLELHRANHSVAIFIGVCVYYVYVEVCYISNQRNFFLIQMENSHGNEYE